MSPAGSKNAPEAKAREKIDALLAQSGWLVQDREDMNLTAGDSIGSVSRYHAPETGRVIASNGGTSIATSLIE